jgi:hypothetical protein
MVAGGRPVGGQRCWDGGRVMAAGEVVGKWRVHCWTLGRWRLDREATGDGLWQEGPWRLSKRERTARCLADSRRRMAAQGGARTGDDAGDSWKLEAAWLIDGSSEE